MRIALSDTSESDVEYPPEHASTSTPVRPRRSALVSPRDSQRATTRAPKSPAPSNRFGLDSDTPTTSEDDSDAQEDEDLHLTPRPAKGKGRVQHSVKFVDASTDDEAQSEFPLTRNTPNESTESPNRPPRSQRERREHEDFYTAVKLRQRRDLVQEYEERNRRDALKSAQAETSKAWQPITTLLNTATTITRTATELSEEAAQQMEEVRRVLEKVSLEQTQKEKKVRDDAARQTREFQTSIEATIRAYEDDIRKAAEAEARAKAEKEAAEKRAREEAERAREEIERAKKAAEEEQRQRKETQERQAQEQREKQLQAQKEKEARQAAEEAAKQKNAGYGALNKDFGPGDPREELEAAKTLLWRIKSEIMPQVKKTKSFPDRTPNLEWKKEATRLRRQIVPKIGQVTNTASEVERISAQISEILRPAVPHPEPLYIALLYFLSKAFLKQAEEEVTARASTAYPLARILVFLTTRHEHTLLADIFYAKLVSMTAHWVIGCPIGREPGMTDDQYRALLGYRSNESSVQYVDRICGLVTLYAAILQTPLPPPPAPTFASLATSASQSKTPLPPRNFRLPRLWIWITRLLNEQNLMLDRAAPAVLASILETTGDVAIGVWSEQMHKIRMLLALKARENSGSHVLGGPEGTAARTRLGLLCERWIETEKLNSEGREYAS